MSIATSNPGVIDMDLPPHARHVPATHWRNAKDEAEAAKLGMWLFLATEILLFAGFFCAYSAFRLFYPHNWHAASEHYLNWKIGFANTVVLLLSSYTVVLAIRGAQTNRRWMILLNLFITELCAAFFLVVKLRWEYWPKYQHGELPGGLFNYAGYLTEQAEHAAGTAAAAAHEAAAPVVEHAAAAVAAGAHEAYIPQPHDHIFLSVYWISTATHGFHVFAGMFIIGWAMWMAARQHYGPKHYTS